MVSEANQDGGHRPGGGARSTPPGVGPVPEGLRDKVRKSEVMVHG